MTAAEMPAGAAPERAPDWHSIEWKTVWRTVRRLQARIVKAVAEGRWNKVKALVYLLTHSFSGRALAILRVVTGVLHSFRAQGVQAPRSPFWRSKRPAQLGGIEASGSCHNIVVTTD